MPKKKTNQFGEVTGTTTAGAPGDENAPAPTVKLNKDGTPRKKGGRTGPRVVDQRIKDLLTTQADELAAVKAAQKTALDTLREAIKTEKQTAVMAARVAKQTMGMTPAELEWLQKSIADKLAAQPAEPTA
jgi:hypothetical protein